MGDARKSGGRIFCSFCGRTNEEVCGLVVSQLGATICDSCFGRVADAFGRQLGVEPEGVYALLREQAARRGREWLREQMEMARAKDGAVIEIRGRDPAHDPAGH